MKKIDKLLNYLDSKYPLKARALTGSRYYLTPLFEIRLSNHLPSDTNKTDMYILIPNNTEVFVVSMGYSIYTFPSATKTIEFISKVVEVLPILKGMKFEEDFCNSVKNPSLIKKEKRTISPDLAEFELLKRQNQQYRIGFGEYLKHGKMTKGNKKAIEKFYNKQ